MAQDTGSHAATGDNARGTKTVEVIVTTNGEETERFVITGKASRT